MSIQPLSKAAKVFLVTSLLQVGDDWVTLGDIN